ncbi:MAG TPA: hypothetical protein VGQ83_27480 [Polyangia bacterium]|jgi:hypothetical protein
MPGHNSGRDALGLAVFGPGVALVYYLAFRPPARLNALLCDHFALNVAATLVMAVLAAYCCRRVVRALLRLCGF